jgi:hypothetical protein
MSDWYSGMSSLARQDNYVAPQEGMNDLAQTMHYSPLDARALIDSGAIRVVRHPNDKSNDPEAYSLVTHWNDLQPDSQTASWPNKPEAYAAAQRDLANPKSGALYDGKYRQIMWSANKRGMPGGFDMFAAPNQAQTQPAMPSSVMGGLAAQDQYGQRP